MANPKIVVPRLKDLSLGLQDPKTFKRVKISKSLFRDFLINQIDHEEPENRGPETLESILRAQELNAFLIKSKFQRQKDPSLGLKYFLLF